MPDRSVFAGDPPDPVDWAPPDPLAAMTGPDGHSAGAYRPRFTEGGVRLCPGPGGPHEAAPGQVTCRHHAGPGVGHHAEIPLPGPVGLNRWDQVNWTDLDDPRHPNPSVSTAAGPRWFGPVVVAATVVALVAAVLLVRSERADRDADASDRATEFTTEACTP